MSIKPTGIIRRIDDLGRVVIPRELRKVLKINEGDPLELFNSDVEGEIIIRKYVEEEEKELDYRKMWSDLRLRAEVEEIDLTEMINIEESYAVTLR